MIAAEEHGRGTTIVAVHGVGLDRHLWDRCLPMLCERHRVVTVDVRGHGASPPARAGVTLRELADDLLAVVADPAHVVGFSLGALIATRFALDHPHRVRSIGLISSVANRSDEQRAAVRARLRAARDDRESAVDGALSRWFAADWATREPTLLEQIRATMLAIDRASYLACYSVFAEADAELWPVLPSLHAPALVMTGADDQGSTPQMAFDLAERIPNARAQIVAGARHLLPLERPQAVARAILDHVESSDDPGQPEPVDVPALHRR